MKTVCTIIVTYNRVATLQRSLPKILCQRFQPGLILVVDNNSSDATQQYAEAVQRSCSNVVYLKLPENIGYAGGIAQGMRHAMSLSSYDYFWVMDDDTLYGENALGQLVEAIDDSGYDVMGLEGSNIRFGIKRPITFNSEIESADYVLIDGSLLKGQVVAKIGAPLEKFFMMCEDHEYCKRIRRSNYSIGIIKDVENERLFLGGGGRFTRSTLWRNYYQSRNHVLILREYFSISDLLGFIYWHTKMMVAAALLAPDRFQRIKFRLIGLWHGIRGIAGKTLDPATMKFVRYE